LRDTQSRIFFPLVYKYTDFVINILTVATLATPLYAASFLTVRLILLVPLKFSGSELRRPNVDATASPLLPDKDCKQAAEEDLSLPGRPTTSGAPRWAEKPWLKILIADLL
jgi:hypothetical protein